MTDFKAGIKKISGDYMLEFISTAAVTAVMQLLLYPLIARTIGNVSYGHFLTVIGIVNTLAAMVGSTLNNVRLVRESDYQEKQLNGDFNVLLAIMCAIVMVIAIFVFCFAFHLGFLESFITAVLVGCMAVRNYWSVEYRLQINYKKSFGLNSLLALGYVFGCLGLVKTGIWLIPFLFGETICGIYLFLSTNLYKEPYRTTKQLWSTVKDIGFIGTATISANVLLYLDRLILYPLLGGEAVTVYSVASLGGKFLGILAVPLSGVLLTYYSHPGFRMTRKRYWMISIVIIAGCLASLLVIIPISPLIIRILYPAAYKEALSILLPANIAGVLVVINTFIQPSVLKFVGAKWQIVKELLYGVIYLSVGCILLKQYGLIGFCIGSIIAIVVKILFMLVLGHFFGEFRE